MSRRINRDHAETLCGLPIEDFDPRTGLADVANRAFRIRTSWAEHADDPDSFLRKLDALLTDPQFGALRALVIGVYSPDMGLGANRILEYLVAHAPRLRDLEGMFVGDITREEQEISWIVQGDHGPLLSALPRIETYTVRGGRELAFSDCSSDTLRRLVVQTAGLSAAAIRDIAAARLPRLEHLELWFGTDSHGWDGTVDTVRPLLAGGQFPALRSLGLRNCEIADDIAQALAGAPILQQLERLDLSGGMLTDKGGEALLANPAITRLRTLDLHHHFLGDAVMERLSILGGGSDTEVVLDDRQTPDEYEGETYYFIELGE